MGPLNVASMEGRPGRHRRDEGAVDVVVQLSGPHDRERLLGEGGGLGPVVAFHGHAVDQPLLVEPPNPAAGGVDAPGGVGGSRQAGDQAGDPVGVTGGLGMVNGGLRQPVGLAPQRRAGMELGD